MGTAAGRRPPQGTSPSLAPTRTSGALWAWPLTSPLPALQSVLRARIRTFLNISLKKRTRMEPVRAPGENFVLSAAAADEPLFHSLNDVIHETDNKLSSGEADWVRWEKRSLDTTKDNATSNNCRLCLIDSCAPSAHQESLQRSPTLSEMGKSDHSLASNTADSDMMSRITPATQSHNSEAPYSGSGEQEQICRDARAGVDSHVLLTGTSQWASVRAIRCDVTDNQSLSPEERLETAGASVVCVSALRIHLDPVDISSRTAAVLPQHSRIHELDLHQVDGGFSIISEEEESDVGVRERHWAHAQSQHAASQSLSLLPVPHLRGAARSRGGFGAGDAAGSSSHRRGAEERGAAGCVHPLPPAVGQ